ncbi:MAG: hypothetical protein ACJASV_002228 [Pseudorhodobacter sp.]|jgi:hypothetical protein
MLGYITTQQRGLTDQLLAEVATVLRVEEHRLAGVVQVNQEFDPARPCHMDLHVLNGGEVIRISQNLGALSKGCRLDPAGLEQAVGLVAHALEAGPRLLIINKFGKQEADGRGFRPLIGQALAAGIPVLTAVSADNHPAFALYAEELAEQLAAETQTILHWCRTQMKDAQ